MVNRVMDLLLGRDHPALNLEEGEDLITIFAVEDIVDMVQIEVQIILSQMKLQAPEHQLAPSHTEKLHLHMLEVSILDFQDLVIFLVVHHLHHQLMGILRHMLIPQDLAMVTVDMETGMGLINLSIQTKIRDLENQKTEIIRKEKVITETLHQETKIQEKAGTKGTPKT